MVGFCYKKLTFQSQNFRYFSHYYSFVFFLLLLISRYDAVKTTLPQDHDVFFPMVPHEVGPAF